MGRSVFVQVSCPNNNPLIADMSNVELRREIKKAVDRLPAERLASLADYVHFLGRPPLGQRLGNAEKAIAVNKGVPWRKARSDV